MSEFEEKINTFDMAEATANTLIDFLGVKKINGLALFYSVKLELIANFISHVAEEENDHESESDKFIRLFKDVCNQILSSQEKDVDARIFLAHDNIITFLYNNEEFLRAVSEHITLIC